jgi:hypothetical protein
VTRGELIVPAEAVTCDQSRDGQGAAKDSEQSDVGVVVNKLAGKAVMASESAQESSMQASTQKAGT